MRRLSCGEIFTVLAAFTAVICGVGCGYSVAQTRAPYGAHRIQVVPFSETVPVGLSADVTSEIARLLAAGGVELSTSADACDARLLGTVSREATIPSPTLVGATITAYRVMVGVDMQLVDNKGKTLWSSSVTISEDFATPGSNSPVQGSPALPLGIEASRRRALLRASERAMRTLHEQLILAGAFKS